MNRRERSRLAVLSVLLAWPVEAARPVATASLPPAPSAPPAGLAPAPWVEPVPVTPGETALRAVFASGRVEPDALLAAAAREPRSVAAGLARLAAALALVESGRDDEALAALADPDLARTALNDYAHFTAGRAHDARGDHASAASSYRQAAALAAGRPLACTALTRAGEALAGGGQAEAALLVIEEALAACPQGRARLLLRGAEIRDAQGQAAAAAEAYDRLEREYPASAYARGSETRRRALQALLPPPTPAEKAARAARRALALFDAQDWRAAEPALAAALAAAPAGDEAELLRVRYGRALLARKKTRQGLETLARVSQKSPHAAEAAYHAARAQSKPAARLAAFEQAARFQGSPWAEEALLSLAAHYQKDLLDSDALPYYRRLVQEYPEGRYTDRAAWRVGWGDFRAGRFEDAARVWEWAARARAQTGFTAGFLYWAGRAHDALGRRERARSLLSEAHQRFKRHYHGLRAAETLARLGGPLEPSAALVATRPPAADEIPEPHLTRLRQLLLIERVAEALDELRGLPSSPAVQASVARLEWREGRLRPAINAMRRAFPGYVGSAGDRLPEDVLRILYPLEHREAIETAAAAAGLDPALVAALVCQESTFDAGAVSKAGARGLMQIMPATGRALLRSLGRRYRRDALHDARTSLELGTAYLRQMLDRFGGRPELALAAYNAGPHRVDAWTARRPDGAPEEFVESIPFTETRTYVMTILAAREQYRRLYDLSSPAQAVASGAAQPRAARP